MDVAEAQREVRNVYIGGFAGHIVVGILWIISASLTTWVSLKAGAVMLVAAGFFIFPLTQVVLRVCGLPASLPARNPLKELAIETAFIIGPLLLLVGAATLHKAAWFYPSMMLVVGAHYLPFSFLYGMRHYLVLAVVLMLGGVFVGLYGPNFATASAWLSGVVFLIFAFVVRGSVSSEFRHAVATSHEAAESS